MVQPDLRKHAGIQDLVERKVDVIVVTTSFGAQAAKRTTSTIPIVITSSADPVGAGLVANLPHPGANVTGFTLMETHLHAKRLELLKETLPSCSRVAVLWNPTMPNRESGCRAIGHSLPTGSYPSILDPRSFCGVNDKHVKGVCGGWGALHNPHST
jgi:ABC-type uncharacterized transport system substrate-binding protein